MCAEVPCLPFSLWHTVVCVCVCMKSRGRQWVSCHSLPYSFAAGALTEPGPMLVATKLQCLHGIQVTGTHGSSGSLHGRWGIELRSSCLLTKCYPLSHPLCPSYLPDPVLVGAAAAICLHFSTYYVGLFILLCFAL